VRADPMTELPKLERAWMSAWIARDRDCCDHILDDEFLLSSARGMLVRKTEWLVAAMGPFSCSRFDWLEVLVRPFGDVAVVNSKIRQQASVNGQDWSGVFILTDIWVARGDVWKVVGRHGTGPLQDGSA